MEGYIESVEGSNSAVDLTTLVITALEDQNIYNYSKLRFNEHLYEKLDNGREQVLKTLELFSYGQWLDYIRFQQEIMDLSCAAQDKLKYITLLRLIKRMRGKCSNIVLYSDLQKGIGLTNCPKSTAIVELYLKTLIHDSCINGKLNSPLKQIRVFSVNFIEDTYIYDRETTAENTQKLRLFSSPECFEKSNSPYQPFIRDLKYMQQHLAKFQSTNLVKACKVMQINSSLEDLLAEKHYVNETSTGGMGKECPHDDEMLDSLENTKKRKQVG